MKQETINKIIKHLTAISQSKLSIDLYQQNNNLSTTFIKSKIAAVKKAHERGNIDSDSYNTILSLYNKCKKNNKDLEDTDNRAEVNIERDENGKIVKYSFKVYIRNKTPLSGSFTRDEMSLIYRLYSSYGSNITQREVSRFFPEFSLCDFKRVLRTFNITKASAPFPQHIIEEYSKEELLEMQFREKENDFLKSYEAEKVRQLDSQLKKYMKENADLKEQFNSFNGLLSELDLSKINTKFEPKTINKDDISRDLIIWLSDIHIGAYTTDYALYDNTYDEEEVNIRLNKVFAKINDEFASFGSFNNIIICNLGDSLDGYNGKTNRGTELAQNMSNKDQVKTFITAMTEFISKIVNYIPCNNIKYYAVGESNHGSDFEYAANTALAYICKSMNVEATVFEKAIDHFTVGNVTYIITHGNDNKNMTRGLPLTINDKTENYINEYLDYNNISGKVVFVKGDLHQSATTNAKRFVYKSVGSLYGSSDWIQANFGFTKACCDYSIVDYNGDRLDGVIILN